MLYNSTRTAGKQVKASEAILRGLSEDGGLFVPESIPALDKSLKELSQMSYQQVAYEVMKLYLTDFTEEDGIIHSASFTDYLCKEESCNE